jgi:hypothetical protein
MRLGSGFDLTAIFQLIAAGDGAEAGVMRTLLRSCRGCGCELIQFGCLHEQARFTNSFFRANVRRFANRFLNRIHLLQ